MAQNDEPTLEFDLDALQAQINMAMAETEELVSSWIQPSGKSTQRPKKSTQEMEYELKEYLRRPPRLGVGAPIPDPVGPSAQEEAKLKNKLIGNGKKRRREDETLPKPEEEVDDEESKKGESSTKIVRLDPFSRPRRKAKQKEPVINSIKKSIPIHDVTVRMQPADSNASGAHAKHDEDETKASSNTDDANCAPIMNGTSTPAQCFPAPSQVGDSPAVHDGIGKHDEATRTLGSSAGPASSTLVGLSQAQLSMHTSFPQAPQGVPTSPTSLKKKKKKRKRKKHKLEPPHGAISASSLTSPLSVTGESTTSATGDDKSSTATTFRPNGVVRGLSGRSLPRKDDIGLVPNVQASFSVAADGEDNNKAEAKEADVWTRFGDSVLDDMEIDSGSSYDGEETSTPAKPNGILSIHGRGPSTSQTQHPILPLLNLSGPPFSGIDNTRESIQSPSSKKKRKRRKKKNKQHGPEMTANTENES